MTSNAKHAFRFFFRSEYGPAKLKYPVFGKTAAQEFDNLDLRTFSNYSWSLSYDPRCTFMRDQFNRDLQFCILWYSLFFFFNIFCNFFYILKLT